MTVTIHGAFGLCNNDEFGSEELYVVVKRLDLDLQDRIDDIEREAQQITGRGSWRYAQQRVDSLRKQDFNSKSDPLSEAEVESLARLRDMKPTERTRDQDRELRLLRDRVPISTADASVLARMRELESQRRRLLRRVQMHSSANQPGSLRVYPDDELQVVLMEDDPFFDDTCFGSTVLLDPSALTTPSLEIKKERQHLVDAELQAVKQVRPVWYPKAGIPQLVPGWECIPGVLNRWGTRDSPTRLPASSVRQFPLGIPTQTYLVIDGKTHTHDQPILPIRNVSVPARRLGCSSPLTSAPRHVSGH